MEKEVKRGEISLWTESFGVVGRPAILMILGLMMPGIICPDEFCEMLVDGGMFVIRYDQRDTGRSSKLAEPYGMEELAEDGVAILDSYGIESAYVMGCSMGGDVAMLMGLNFPERVLGMVLMMTSADPRVYIATLHNKSVAGFSLPPPKKELVDYYKILRSQTNMEEFVQDKMGAWRICHKDTSTFDEEWLRSRYEMMWKKYHENIFNPNHLKVFRKFQGCLERLHEIRVPVLIIHGEEDPLFPVEHAEAMHREIKHSRLLVLKKFGHCFFPSWAERIASEVLRFFF